jgi:hypothetical protein
MAKGDPAPEDGYFLSESGADVELVLRAAEQRDFKERLAQMQHDKEIAEDVAKESQKKVVKEEFLARWGLPVGGMVGLVVGSAVTSGVAAGITAARAKSAHWQLHFAGITTKW